MYETYWQLQQKPFENTADPRFYYPGESHQAALLKLRYAVENRRGGALLTGPSGSGKTLLTGMLRGVLGADYSPFVHLVFPQMSTAELLAYLADEFDGDYDLDIDGFDYQGRADGVAGAVGVGQIVPGWRLFIDDAWITLVDVGDELRITSKDIRAAHARSTAAELAETPTKPHKIVGDNEAHLPAVAAGAGWLEAEVLGADDANQQLLIKHVGPGASVYCGCGIDFDGKGHMRCLYYNGGWIGPCA